MSKKRAKITKGEQSINSNKTLGEVESTLTYDFSYTLEHCGGTSSRVEIGQDLELEAPRFHDKISFLKGEQRKCLCLFVWFEW